MAARAVFVVRAVVSLVVMASVVRPQEMVSAVAVAQADEVCTLECRCRQCEFVLEAQKSFPRCPCAFEGGAVCGVDKTALRNVVAGLECTTGTDHCTQGRCDGAGLCSLYPKPVCTTPGFFLNGSCSAVVKPPCAACTVCVLSETFEITPCSSLHNRQCKACQACRSDTYVSVACTLTSDTVCQPCHPECLGGCSGPSQTQCTACRNVLQGDKCVLACDNDEWADNGVCRPVTTACAPGEVEVAPPTATSDRKCGVPQKKHEMLVPVLAAGALVAALAVFGAVFWYRRGGKVRLLTVAVDSHVRLPGILRELNATHSVLPYKRFDKQARYGLSQFEFEEELRTKPMLISMAGHAADFGFAFAPPAADPSDALRGFDSSNAPELPAMPDTPEQDSGVAGRNNIIEAFQNQGQGLCCLLILCNFCQSGETAQQLVELGFAKIAIGTNRNVEDADSLAFASCFWLCYEKSGDAKASFGVARTALRKTAADGAYDIYSVGADVRQPAAAASPWRRALGGLAAWRSGSGYSVQINDYSGPGDVDLV